MPDIDIDSAPVIVSARMEQAFNDGKGMFRVLVVEDDADTLTFLGKLLSRIPADGVPTATCAAARYAFKTIGKFDLVVADVALPDGSGVELLAELKAEHGCHTVIMSGYDTPPDGLPAGVDKWITKPVDLGTLRAVVERLSGR